MAGPVKISDVLAIGVDGAIACDFAGTVITITIIGLPETGGTDILAAFVDGTITIDSTITLGPIGGSALSGPPRSTGLYGPPLQPFGRSRFITTTVRVET